MGLQSIIIHSVHDGASTEYTYSASTTDDTPVVVHVEYLKTGYQHQIELLALATTWNSATHAEYNIVGVYSFDQFAGPILDVPLYDAVPPAETHAGMDATLSLNGLQVDVVITGRPAGTPAITWSVRVRVIRSLPYQQG